MGRGITSAARVKPAMPTVMKLLPNVVLPDLNSPNLSISVQYVDMEKVAKYNPDCSESSPSMHNIG